MRRLDLTNQQFGSLRVIGEVGRNRYNKSIWSCECTCGRITQVTTNNLRTGATRSCGCLRNTIKRKGKHHLSHTPEYKAWANMKSRCLNTKDQHYQDYGARGVKICHRWLNSFEAFLQDMKLRPSSAHSLDRINNDGDYTPENCRWTIRLIQQNNRRNNVLIEFRGRTQTRSQWAREYGLNTNVLIKRLSLGWTIEQALVTPTHYPKQSA